MRSKAWTSVCRRSFMRSVRDSPVVGELELDAEVPPSERLDDGLKIVLALPGDPDLVFPDLGLHLQSTRLDVLHDLPGLLHRDALLDLDPLADRAPRGGLHLPVPQRLHRDPSLPQ